jgi:hypothetical protein
VLGGTGFVGHAFIEELLKQCPLLEITSISRRGRRKDDKEDRVRWVSGDANLVVGDVIDKYGPFDACVHTIGLLLDNESGLSQLNKFASGSGSTPDTSSTYDYVTRQTAFSAIKGLRKQVTRSNIPNSQKSDLPFVFVSAAEAGWTFKVPVEWLSKYLDAKRSVERELLESSRDIVRPVVFRPSLIWQVERPQAILSVLPFYIGSAMNIPFIDRPVLLSSLVKAMVTSLRDETKTITGIQRFNDIDRLSLRKF